MDAGCRVLLPCAGKALGRGTARRAAEGVLFEVLRVAVNPVGVIGNSLKRRLLI
jgi:hypothetical protein